MWFFWHDSAWVTSIIFICDYGFIDPIITKIMSVSNNITKKSSLFLTGFFLIRICTWADKNYGTLKSSFSCIQFTLRCDRSRRRGIVNLDKPGWFMCKVIDEKSEYNFPTMKKSTLSGYTYRFTSGFFQSRKYWLIWLTIKTFSMIFYCKLRCVVCVDNFDNTFVGVSINNLANS